MYKDEIIFYSSFLRSFIEFIIYIAICIYIYFFFLLFVLALSLEILTLVFTIISFPYFSHFNSHCYN